jgi:16S rRNA (guanine1207-N2)-methyltransferase
MASRGKAADHYFAEHPKSTPRFGLVRAYLRGRPFEFLTESGVFSKRRIDLGTRLLIESMILPKEGRILDIGCGYGPIGIAAAAFNPRLEVTLIDVNARAVTLARYNIKKNFLCNADVRRGHLYEPVKDMTFDCVLSNPPVSAGLETLEAIICNAPRHMKHKASFQIVVKSKVGGKRLQMTLKQAFENAEILARESGHRVLISEKGR